MTTVEELSVMNLHIALVIICCLPHGLPLNRRLHCVSECKLFRCKSKIESLQFFFFWIFTGGGTGPHLNIFHSKLPMRLFSLYKIGFKWTGVLQGIQEKRKKEEKTHPTTHRSKKDKEVTPRNLGDSWPMRKFITAQAQRSQGRASDTAAGGTT
jgi:hypothetical protein